MNRYIARIVLEAESVLAIGSDILDHHQDAPIEKDFNGLPYIPGTALAGVLYRVLGEDFKQYFGKSNKEKSRGSDLIFSDALLFDGCKTMEEMVLDPFEETYFSYFENLPIRPHALHGHTGATSDTGLFDQEIVFKGSRFKFELKLESENDVGEDWKDILKKLNSEPLFIGSGQYRGYGLCKIVELKTAVATTFDMYAAISSSLNEDSGFEPFGILEPTNKWEKLELNTQNTLFHFGSGYGDADADNICYKEKKIVWNKEKPNLIDCYVIPASSIKGPIAHRVAFLYNKAKNITIEELSDSFQNQKKFNTEVGRNTGFANTEVLNLFGSAKESKEKTGQAGRVVFKDIYLEKVNEVKLMHNSIDRFTGGTLSTALFSEKAINVDNILIEYLIEGVESEYLKNALDDLKNGTLPIGGLAAKGHGVINTLIS